MTETTNSTITATTAITSTASTPATNSSKLGKSLVSALVNDLMPSLDEALDAYEASGSTEDFNTWNVKFVDEYADAKISGRLENAKPAVSSEKKPAAKPAKKSATKNDGIKKVKAEIMPGQTSLIPKKTDVAIAAEKKRLDESTNYIRKEVKTVASSFLRIGYKLFEIKSKELYTSQGFKNISEYGEKVLGFKKSSTANYIAICEHFSEFKNGKPTAQLSSKYSSFGYSQLSEMLALPESKVEQAKPDMTVKEIRSLKDSKKVADTGKSSAYVAPEYDNNGQQD